MPRRYVCLVFVLLLGTPLLLSTAGGQPENEAVSETDFRRSAATFLEDPLADAAKDHVRKIMLFAVQSKAVEVVIGKIETDWIGDSKEHGGLLFAGYLAGNMGSQIDSGVKRNDRYAGILTLLRVHRALEKKHDDYKNPGSDALLKLQREGKLLRHVAELDESMPALPPGEE